MKRAMLLLFVMSGFLLFVAPPAKAIPITVEFTARNFIYYGSNPPGPNPPTDPVSGTIVYDAASTTANINSLISINMTISGHTYGVGEVGFLSYGSYQLIGGLVNGVGSEYENTNDFDLLWDQSSLVPTLFEYATSPGLYSTRDFTKFTVTSAPVPIPGALVLFGSGLIGLVGIGRMRRRK